MSTVTARIHDAAMRIFSETGGNAIAVSDLAREAGLSRGTIYNNVEDPSRLLATSCELMAEELHLSVLAHIERIGDPAQRISDAVRLCIRRVHDEPDWGRFVARYAMTEPRLGDFWGRAPADVLRDGVASGRFDIGAYQIASACAAMGGATFGAITLVLRGYQTWRRAASDTSELVLCGLGIDRGEARRLSEAEFEPLPRLSAFAGA